MSAETELLEELHRELKEDGHRALLEALFHSGRGLGPSSIGPSKNKSSKNPHDLRNCRPELRLEGVPWIG
jgi:hypothetical protein